MEHEDDKYQASPARRSIFILCGEQ